MKRDEIYTKVTDIFRDVFDDEDINITDATTAADIEGWDSLTHITLFNEIENAFDCKFSMNDVISLKNVGEMMDLLETKTGV